MKSIDIGFIKENIAPPNIKKLSIYDDSNARVGSIMLNGMKPPSENPTYRFCALSDIHLTYDTANEDFQRALTYAENYCDFTCIAGDLTSNAAVVANQELELYQSIVTAYAPTKPVYSIAGNHENYSVLDSERFENCVGNPLYYSFTQGNDVFIMVGHYGAYRDTNWQSDDFVSTEELQWLYETLETNRNKRCFVFNHVFPYEHSVGNPNNLYHSVLPWRVSDGFIGQAYIDLLRHYKNTILFHGHTHTRLSCQEFDKIANYSNANGYRSIHIPSLAVPRDIIDGSLSNIYAESEGYIVDVYDDCIVLNGRDFIDNDSDGHIIPIATYKIDTTLVDVPAGTFIDSTGTIIT